MKEIGGNMYKINIIYFVCKKLNIIVIRGKTIKFNYKNKEKFYFSDYYLKDLNLIIEIKSSYIYELHKELNLVKQKFVLEQGYNFIFIMDKKYDEFLFKIKNPAQDWI